VTGITWLGGVIIPCIYHGTKTKDAISRVKGYHCISWYEYRGVPREDIYAQKEDLVHTVFKTDHIL
jgi:hypothetical protein